MFHQPAGIFSAMASEGAAVSFLPPLGLGNVRTAFQDGVIELSGVICLMALFAYKNPTTGVVRLWGMSLICPVGTNPLRRPRRLNLIRRLYAYRLRFKMTAGTDL